MGYYRKLKEVIFKSTTFEFSEKQMHAYFLDIKNGVDKDRALASLLGCPKKADHVKFLKKRLTQHEYEILNIEFERKYPY